MKLGSNGVSVETIAEIDARPNAVETGDARLDAIAAYATKLTLTPTEMTEDDIEDLRSHGLSDLDILDVNNISAYYNYINRVVMGLGLRSVMTSTHYASNAVPAEVS